MKIRPVEAELLYAGGRTDGQTDRRPDNTKLIVAFHNFASEPKNECKRQNTAMLEYLM
jgi:hypothetical protein